MELKAEFKGSEKLQATLKELGGREAAQAVRSAMALASTRIVQALRKNAPVNSGALKKSFGKQSRLYQTGEVKTWVGVRGDFVLKHAKTTIRWTSGGATDEQGNVIESVQKERVVYRDHKPVMYAARVEKKSNKNSGWMAKTWNAAYPVFEAEFNRLIWERIKFYAAKKAAKTAA